MIKNIAPLLVGNKVWLAIGVSTLFSWELRVHIEYTYFQYFWKFIVYSCGVPKMFAKMYAKVIKVTQYPYIDDIKCTKSKHETNKTLSIVDHWYTFK